MQTAEGKLYLFVGIDRTGEFAVTQLVGKADRKTAREFLQHMLEAFADMRLILSDPCHSDGSSHWIASGPKDNGEGQTVATTGPRTWASGIEHRLTKPNHPWTNGQVERTRRTIKEATLKRFHDDCHDQLHTHLEDSIAAYNFAGRVKTLGGFAH